MVGRMTKEDVEEQITDIMEEMTSELSDRVVDIITKEIDKNNRKQTWNVHKIKSCKEGDFHGIKCLESDDQYGFFKSGADIRPSSCTWIDKEDAERLYVILSERIMVD
jgi:hypothetical protein